MRFRFLFCFIALILVVLPVASSTADAAGDRRVALVIGNNDYQYAKKLDNAVADAQAFRRELEARGFQVVYRENANRRAMNGAMEEFVGKLSTDAIGLIYYSGHGVQINGANYLIPTDLSAKAASDFAYDAVDLTKLVDRVSQTQAKFALAVIDACRDNPFQGTGRDIGGSRGLVAPSGNASGVMVVYSAGANQKALDRLSDADRNPNGLFTREFLKAMRIPGLTVQEAVNQIKMSVIAQAKSVGHVQTPAIYDQSVGTFVFTPGATPAPVDNVIRPNPVVAPPAITAEQREDAFWADAKSTGNKEAFEAYVVNYPAGRYANLARANIARLSNLNVVSVPVVKAPPVVAPVITPPVTKPVITNPARLPGGTFKDCPDCPEMVVIPAGRFVMGAAPGEDESEKLTENFRNRSQPQHGVDVAGFLAGKFEVTRGQYRAFVEATGRSSAGACSVWTGSKFEIDQAKDWRNPGYAQDDPHPVSCVSWDDAKAYTAWLSQKTGKAYRLLTEAEWEYAARAGTTTRRFWGDDGDQSCAYANGADQMTKAQVPDWKYLIANCNDRYAYTAPVGSYRANAFGLYDMLGNVWEWTEDCWNENYSNAPTDGSAWTAGNCSLRVVRGGSWSYNPLILRSALRNWYATANRSSSGGFRVARTD